MLLNGYSRAIFRPQCNPSFQSVHCVAHLNEDISEVLPYLNSVLGGSFILEPPSVTLRMHGKLITVNSREIFINALRDGAEADKILAWLKIEINSAWEKRSEITPTYAELPVPRMLDVLKMLPKTNCGQCGEPTCMVFALRVTEGVKYPQDCPPLTHKSKENLQQYLSNFRFDL